MSRVCRVLPVGPIEAVDSDTNLRNWLAVLLPLSLPKTNIEFSGSLTGVSSHSGGLPVEVTGLLKLAQHGADAVQERLLEIISETLAEVDVEERP